MIVELDGERVHRRRRQAAAASRVVDRLRCQFAQLAFTPVLLDRERSCGTSTRRARSARDSLAGAERLTVGLAVWCSSGDVLSWSRRTACRPFNASTGKALGTVLDLEPHVRRRRRGGRTQQGRRRDVPGRGRGRGRREHRVGCRRRLPIEPGPCWASPSTRNTQSRPGDCSRESICGTDSVGTGVVVTRPCRARRPASGTPSCRRTDRPSRRHSGRVRRSW